MLILPIASFERLQLVKIIDSDIHMITQTTMTANSFPATVKTDKVFSQFTDIFGGLGCLEEKYSFDIDTSLHPKVPPPCKVAVAIYNSLTEELHRMEDMEVITPVSEANPWVSSVVVLPKKNGKYDLNIKYKKGSMMYLPCHLQKQISLMKYKMFIWWKIWT